MRIEGTAAFIKSLKKYEEGAIDAIKGVIEDTATDIEINAIRAAPHFIKSKIDKVFKNEGLTAMVGVQGEDPLPAYFEFSTGLNAIEVLAPYPQWVKDIAREFYVNGQGTLRGQPFLFPAVFRAEFQFQKDLKEVLSGNIKLGKWGKFTNWFKFR